MLFAHDQQAESHFVDGLHQVHCLDDRLESLVGQ